MPQPYKFLVLAVMALGLQATAFCPRYRISSDKKSAPKKLNRGIIITEDRLSALDMHHGMRVAYMNEIIEEMYRFNKNVEPLCHQDVLTMDIYSDGRPATFEEMSTDSKKAWLGAAVNFLMLLAKKDFSEKKRLGYEDLSMTNVNDYLSPLRLLQQTERSHTKTKSNS